MARMIDADEARRRIIAFATGLHSEVLPVDTVMMLLIQMPTVDAVEVVRCKDCIYYCQDKTNGVICRHPKLDFDIECYDHWIKTNPNDFCSYGERNEGDWNG